jgi:hypothetical protein
VYSDSQIAEAARRHASQVNPKANLDEQTIALLARMLRLALNTLEAGHGMVSLNQLLQHIDLPPIIPNVPFMPDLPARPFKDLSRLD